MKRLTRAIICAVALLQCGAAMAQKDTLRILAIANSFGEDAVEQNLHELAEADGRLIIIGDMYIGGCSLERHRNNARDNAPAYAYRKIGLDGKEVSRNGTTLEYALADEKWDIVTLQQVSGYSGQVWTFEPYLSELMAYVREHVPGAKLMWHQTWAYEWNATHSDFPKYDRDQNKMYRAIMDGSEWVSKTYGLPVIPAGTAVQNTRENGNANNITRDGFHMNYSMGRYTVACTWYEAIFGANVVGNSYHPSTLSDTRVRMAQLAAHAANANPYRTTDIGTGKRIVEYDKVAEYTLPDALTTESGTKVKNVAMWENTRRGEILKMFTTEMYGRAPAKPENLRFEVFDTDSTALGGIAIRKQVKIFYAMERYITVLMYTPKFAKGPCPAFMGVNFKGNAAISTDPGIAYPDKAQIGRYGLYHENPRGAAASRWPLELIISRGYGVVTFHTSDVDPDFDDSFRNGVHPHFYAKGQTYPKPDEWGTIAAWAWGLSRALDYLETDADVDASKVAVIGHSRLGKASLWAGASDPRFAMVISNDSGCGGAALSKRHIGENLQIIQTTFPYWFCGNFAKYMDNEAALPFDQHELLSLIAPRPLYVASASEDNWADQEGEFQSLKEASKVYGLYKLPTLEKVSMPAVNTALTAGRLGYHLREGKHDITAYDWIQYLNFADKNLK